MTTDHRQPSLPLEGRGETDPIREALVPLISSMYVDGTLEPQPTTTLSEIVDRIVAVLSPDPVSETAEALAHDPLLAAWRRTKDFLADRLITSGRSDVNINAVLRVMNSAFDGPKTAERTEGIDVERLAKALRAIDVEDWPQYGYDKSAAAIKVEYDHLKARR